MPALYNYGITAGRDEFGREDRAWHKMDIFIDREDLIVEEALVLSKMDQHKVSKRPISYPDADGFAVTSPKHFMLVREVLPEVFDSEYELKPVTDQYTVADMTDVAASINELSKMWPVASACMLDDGAVALFSLRMRDQNFGIAGDEHLSFLTVANDFRGDGGLKYYYSLIRAVCINTYSSGLASASYRVSIPHKGDVVSRLELEAAVTKAAQESKLSAQNELNLWVKTFLTKNQIADVLEAAFPKPAKEAVGMQMRIDDADMFNRLPEKQQVYALNIRDAQEYNRGKMNDRNEEHRNAAATFLAEMADLEPTVTVGPDGKRTAYAVYNAITARTNGYKGRGNVFGQMLPGGERDRMGNRAISAIREIVKQNN